MQILKSLALGAVVAGFLASSVGAAAQTETNLIALRGLAPVSALQGSDTGRAALTANLATTGAIQDGSAHQPLLLSFPDQQQLALRDAFITGGNAAELADGLGSALAAAYQRAAAYTSSDDGKTLSFTSVSPAVAQLIAFAAATERSDSETAKYFFANATTDKTTPASPQAMAILTAIRGTPDVFGKAYHLPAGSKGANTYGDSRPFQTEPRLVTYTGNDYFGVSSGNVAYLRGPSQNLIDSPSYPSGHTAYGYTESLLLALLVPQRYPQLVARAAEYGNDRIVIGAHYAMDVLGGRTLALYDLAQLLANKPGYVGVERRGSRIDDFQKALAAARADVAKALEAGCGNTIDHCAAEDQGRFADAEKNGVLYEVTQTYGLPVVFEKEAAGTEDISKISPEAGYLLTAAFPYLTLAQADDILTATEGPGRGFLDDGSAFGVYSRLDLYRAAEKAIAMGPTAPNSRVR